MRGARTLMFSACLAIVGCSSEADKKQTAESAAGAPASQVAAPQFSPPIADPAAAKPTTSVASVPDTIVQPHQTSSPSPRVPMRLAHQPSSGPGQFATAEFRPQPPGTQMVDEAPIGQNASGILSRQHVPPNAIAAGFVLSLRGNRMPAFRLADGTIVTQVFRMGPGPTSGTPMPGGSPIAVSPIPGEPIRVFPGRGPSSHPPQTMASSDSPEGSQESLVDPNIALSLPGEIEEVVVGGSGRYLLLSLPQLQKVGVFDVRDGKVLKYINVDSDRFSVAAGATQFVVVNHPNLKLEAWNYSALDKPRSSITHGAPADKHAAGSAMGLASEGPLGIAFVENESSSGANSERAKGDVRRAYVELYDLAGLAPLKYSVDWKGNRPVTNRSSADHNYEGKGLQASPAGASFHLLRSAEHSTLNYTGGTLVWKPNKSSPFKHHLAYDGKAFYGNRSVGLAEGGTFEIPSKYDGTLYASYPGHYWIVDLPQFGDADAVQSKLYHFFLAGNSSPIATLRLKAPRDTMNFDREQKNQIFFNSDEKTITAVVGDRRKLVFKRFDIEAEAGKSEQAVLSVVSHSPTEFVPGKKFEYVIRVLSNRGGVTYQLEAGPSGMTVSPDGKCEWLPPDDASARQTAIVLVKDRAGTEIFHNITLARGESPPAEVAVDGKSPTDPNATRLAIRLPAAAEDFVVGAGGRYLLAVMKAKHQIAIIDLRERKIAKLLPTDDDVIKVAAGATKFVVYSGRGTLSRWNFATLERETSVPLPAEISSVAMGSASEGPLLISEKRNANIYAQLYELSTLQPSNALFRVEQNDLRSIMIEDHVAASANGRTFTSWRQAAVPLGVLSYVVCGDRVHHCSRHESAGPVTPSPDGSTLYTVLGECPSRDLTGKSKRVFNDNRLSPRISLPAATGNFALAWPVEANQDGNREVTLHAQGDPKPVLTIPGLKPPTNTAASDEDPLFSRRLLYAPEAEAIVSLGSNLDTVVVQRFSLADSLGKLNGGYLYVASSPPQEMRPGTKLSYQLDVKSSKGQFQFKLNTAPPTAEITSSGLLTWTAPNSSEGPQTFSIGVTDAAGAEAVHSFTIFVDKNAVQSGSNSAVELASIGPVVGASSTSVEVTNVGRPRQAVSFPGPVERLCVGGGGRYLVGVIPSLRQVAVIDVVEQRLVKLLPADDDDLCVAAGRTKFVVSMGTKGVLTRYGFPDCERELTAVVPESQPIHTLAMGCNSEGPVFATAPQGSKPPLMFDLQTLKPITPDVLGREGFSQFGAELGVDAEGRLIVSGNWEARVTGERLSIVSGNREGASGLGLPSADGRVVYYLGSMWNTGAGLIGRDPTAFHLPAAVGPFYARVPPQGIKNSRFRPTLHMQGEKQPILTIDDVEVSGVPDVASLRPLQQLYAERFFLLPTSNAICTLNDASDKLTIYRYILDEELKNSGGEYFFVASVAPARVHPASSMAYQLDVRSKRGGVKYRLESGPPGMTISPTGLVSWKAQKADDSEQVVIAAISDAAGQELLHTFKFRVDDGAPNTPALGTTLPTGDIAAAAIAAADAKARASAASTPPTPTRVAEAPLAPRVEHTLKLPGLIDDACVGGGGRFVVVSMSVLRQVAIVDVVEKRIVKVLPVDDETFFIAAGSKKLVVAMATKNVFVRYDLATGARESIAPFSGSAISDMAMGSASDGPLVTVSGRYHEAVPSFYDLGTLKPAFGGNGADRRDLRLSDSLAASADGTVLGSWASSGSPSGVHVVTVELNKARHAYAGDSVGSVLPSPDGRLVYTGIGMYDADAKPLSGKRSQGYPTRVVMPAASGPLYLSLSPSTVLGALQRDDPDKLRLHIQGETSSIMKIEGIELPKLPQDLHPAALPKFRLDRHIFLVPAAEALVTVTMSDELIHIYRFQLDEELRRTAVDYFFVASMPPAEARVGSQFQYQIEAKSKYSGVKYRLESGPPGMEISPEGLLTWNAARRQAEETVIVSLSNSAKQEAFHTFKLRVIKGSEGAQLTPIPATTPPATSTATAMPTPPSTPSATGTTGVAPSTEYPLRNWKSADGKFSIEARLAGSAGGKVTLVQATGERLDVAIEQLSKEDQDYVAKLPK